MADSGGQSQSFSSQANPFSELRADRGGAGRGVCSTITGTGNDGREGITDASRRPPLSSLACSGPAAEGPGALWSSQVPWGGSVESCLEVGCLPSPSSHVSALWP